MTSYEKLLQEAHDEDISVDENYSFQSALQGLYVDKNIALSNRLLTSIKKAGVLAEELGHYYTSTGNILDQTNVSNCKQERKARLWAYDKMIGLSGIIQGYRQHCQNRYELAECLGVSEEFLQEALNCYKEKYGAYVELDGYVIFFEPALAVMERL